MERAAHSPPDAPKVPLRPGHFYTLPKAVCPLPLPAGGWGPFSSPRSIPAEIALLISYISAAIVGGRRRPVGRPLTQWACAVCFILSTIPSPTTRDVLPGGHVIARRPDIGGLGANLRLQGRLR